MLHEHGISTWGSFVFGFDTDDSEVFDRTVEFGIEMQLTMALFAMLTPYPGTQLYRRLQAEGRLTDERWWLRQRSRRRLALFHPQDDDARSAARRLDARLEALLLAAARSGSAGRVRPRSSWIQIAGYLPLNIMQNRLAHLKIGGGRQRFRTPIDDAGEAARGVVAQADWGHDPTGGQRLDGALGGEDFSTARSEGGGRTRNPRLRVVS